jgi:hypothetical protein
MKHKWMSRKKNFMINLREFMIYVGSGVGVWVSAYGMLLSKLQNEDGIFGEWQCDELEIELKPRMTFDCLVIWV